jgi:hypothetical protein
MTFNTALLLGSELKRIAERRQQQQSGSKEARGGQPSMAVGCVIPHPVLLMVPVVALAVYDVTQPSCRRGIAHRHVCS